MKNIIQKYTKKIKAFFSKEKRQERKKEKAFQRVDALKALLIKTVWGYDAKIQELDREYNKTLVKYNRQYKSYQEAFAARTKKVISEAEFKAEEEAIKPLEVAVEEARQDLSIAEVFKRDDVSDLLAQLNSEKQAYVKAQAEAVKLEAVQALRIKEAYLKQMNQISKRYDDVTGLDNLMAEASGSIDLHHGYKLNEYMIDLTLDAPLKKHHILVELTQVST